MTDQTLATELLSELKAQNRKWFIAFLIVLILWFATIGGFLWYISLPIEDVSITQKADGDANHLVGIGNINGGKSDSKVQETGSKEP